MSRERSKIDQLKDKRDALSESRMGGPYSIGRIANREIEGMKRANWNVDAVRMRKNRTSPMPVNYESEKKNLSIFEKGSTLIGYIIGIFVRRRMARETIFEKHEIEYRDAFPDLNKGERQAGGGMDEYVAAATAVAVRERKEIDLGDGTRVSVWRVEDPVPDVETQEKAIICLEYNADPDAEKALIKWIEDANDLVDEDGSSFNFILVFANYDSLNGADVARLVNLFHMAGAMFTNFPAGSKTFDSAVEAYAESLKGRFIGLRQPRGVHVAGVIG